MVNMESDVSSVDLAFVSRRRKIPSAKTTPRAISMTSILLYSCWPITWRFRMDRIHARVERREFNLLQRHGHVSRSFAFYVKAIFRFRSLKLECWEKVQRCSLFNLQGDESGFKCLRPERKVCYLPDEVLTIGSSDIKMFFEKLKKSVLKYCKIINLMTRSASKDWLMNQKIARG